MNCDVKTQLIYQIMMIHTYGDCTVTTDNIKNINLKSN